MCGIGRIWGIDTSRIAEHVQKTLICLAPKANGRTMMSETNAHPMRVLYRDILGVDTFAVAGDEGRITDPWQDRPHLCKTPAVRA